MKGADVKVDRGRKENTQARVEKAKFELKMQEIAGTSNRGREGLGLTPKKCISTATQKYRRTMIVEAVREVEEDRRVVRMAGLAKQGAHMRYEVPERKIRS